MLHKRVVLGGGRGFIGHAIRMAFENEGYKVFVVSQEDRYNTLSWDRIAKQGLPENVTYVINAAGANVLDFKKVWNAKFKQEVINSRVQTNSILSHAIDQAETKPKAFLTLSGVGIYKPDPEIVYDESFDVKPFDFFSKLVSDWENATKNKSGVRRIAMRSGVVLGRNGGIIKQIYPAYLMHLGGPMGSGKQYFPWIHIDDLVESIIHILTKTSIVGPVNAVAPQILTAEDFGLEFGASMNRKCNFKVPEFIVKLMFGKERATMLLEGQKVLPTRLLTDVRYRFIYNNIKSACEEIMYEYQ